ncbi:MAG TPA: non-homologous end-joining DNA ligase [Acidimicrobiales bacterium]|nr:non-homologous end-joining DNA ligase [Acidimicrobiales bacterium]
MSRSERVETEVGGRRLSLSHLDKVMFPATGFTKGQLIDYYARIAPVMLPHVTDRPVTFRRYPDGVDSKSFFEKHVPSHAPGWLRTIEVPSTSSRGGGSEVEHPLICDLPALVWAANLAVIEFHVPLWRVGRRRKLPAPPDQMVFDLDPGPGASIVECCRVAQWIAELMGEEGSEPLAKTSGSKGMQLYVPLTGRPTWERTRDRAHDLAVRLEGDHPELVVSSMTKAVRKDKVFIDWSQNSASKTTVAAYSVRARSEPTVSTPVDWDEVAACAASGDPDDLRFTTDEVLARVEDRGDLFAPLDT